MSLAVLARKTKTKQRLRSTTCGNGRSHNGQQGRSVGFVLNMTGRGGGIGLSGMSYKQRGSNCSQGVGCPCEGCCSGRCKTGQAGTCCKADKIVSQERRANCGECWYGGLSQPAPQMSYRNYINRKASGAYRPGGKPCCDPKCYDTDYGKNPPYVNPSKNPNTWKQHPNIAASTITEHRRQSSIRCAHALIKRNPVYLGKTLISNRIVAKPVCSWYNPVTCKYETVKGPNPLTQSCQRTTTLPIKSRLGYTRINKNWCNTTKSLTVNNSASDQIAKRKQRAFLCPCPEECPIPDNIDLKAVYPIPGVNPSSIGLLSGPTTLKADSYVVNQAGKQEVCKCDSTKYTLDVTNASGAQTLILTVAYPDFGTGFTLNSDGSISYDDSAFATYLINNPELIVASGTIIQPDSFADLPDIVTFTSKKLGELCAMGYNKLYLMDLSNGPGPGTPINPVPPGSDYVPPIIWNIDCCSDCCENQKRQKSRYCYPRPMATGKCRGLIDFSTKSTVACLRKAQCNK